MGRTWPGPERLVHRAAMRVGYHLSEPRSITPCWGGSSPPAGSLRVASRLASKPMAPAGGPEGVRGLAAGAGGCRGGGAERPAGEQQRGAAGGKGNRSRKERRRPPGGGGRGSSGEIGAPAGRDSRDPWCQPCAADGEEGRPGRGHGSGFRLPTASAEGSRTVARIIVHTSQLAAATPAPVSPPAAPALRHAGSSTGLDLGRRPRYAPAAWCAYQRA